MYIDWSCWRRRRKWIQVLWKKVHRSILSFRNQFRAHMKMKWHFWWKTKEKMYILKKKCF